MSYRIRSDAGPQGEQTAMQRAIAAQPDLFTAYYEPMIGGEMALPSAARLKRIYARSTTALRHYLTVFK